MSGNDALKRAIVTGAIEAAETISTRLVRGESDRLKDYIGGVEGRADYLETAVRSLQGAAVALSEGYDHMSSLLQAELAARLEDIQKAVQATVDARVAGESKAAQGEASQVIAREVSGLGERLLEHLESRHRAAVEHADKVSASAHREMAAHLGGLARDIAKGVGEDVTKVSEMRLEAMEKAIQEHLAESATLSEQVAEQNARVEAKFATLGEELEARTEKFLSEDLQRSREELRAALQDGLDKLAGEAKERALRTLERTEQRAGETLVEITSAVSALVPAVADAKRAVDDALIEAEQKMETRADDIERSLEEALNEGVDQAVQQTKQVIDETKNSALEELDRVSKELRDTVAKHLGEIELPDPIPGEPGAPGAPGANGVLRRVDQWDRERAYSKNGCAHHLGGVWQCKAGLTEEEPGSSVDWVSLVRGIESGWVTDEGNLIFRYSDHTKVDAGNLRGPRGREWEHQGTFDPERKDYEWGHVVVVRGTSYVARHDAPGGCPGAGWRMVAQAKPGTAGRRGPVGKAGDPGPPGAVGPPGQSVFARGRYVAGETYYPGEVVPFGSALFIALQETTAAPKADQENWDLFFRATSGGGGVASSDGSVQNIITMTQVEYDALSPPSDHVLYLICG